MTALGSALIALISMAALSELMSMFTEDGSDAMQLFVGLSAAICILSACETLLRALT